MTKPHHDPRLVGLLPIAALMRERDLALFAQHLEKIRSCEADLGAVRSERARIARFEVEANMGGVCAARLAYLDQKERGITGALAQLHAQGEPLRNSAARALGKWQVMAALSRGA